MIGGKLNLSMGSTIEAYYSGEVNIEGYLVLNKLSISEHCPGNAGQYGKVPFSFCGRRR